MTTHCLSAGSYEFVARDFGNVGRGWNAGTSLAVLELTPANGMYFHGRPLGGSADSPTWFDRGESAKFTFDARGSAAAATGRRVGGGRAERSAASTRPPSPRSERCISSPKTPRWRPAREPSPRAARSRRRREVVDESLRPRPRRDRGGAAMVGGGGRRREHSRRRRDAVERVSLLHSEATGAYGADDASTVSASKKSDDGSPSRVVVAAALAPRPPSASRPSSASRDTRRTLPLSAPRSGSLSTRLGVCAAQGCAGVRFSSLPIARLERTRTGAACSRTCRAARAPLACDALRRARSHVSSLDDRRCSRRVRPTRVHRGW